MIDSLLKFLIVQPFTLQNVLTLKQAL